MKQEGGNDGDRLTYLVSVARLPKDGMPIRFEAGPAEREALARQLQVPAVEQLTADLLLSPWRGEGVRLTGRFSARVERTCVVTLDPLIEELDEEIDRLFVPEDSKLARRVRPQDKEIHLDPEGDDIPDEFSGDRIDIGQALSENLALSLDPHPRKPGAEFPAYDTDPDPDEGERSPFDALRKLKTDGNS